MELEIRLLIATIYVLLAPCGAGLLLGVRKLAVGRLERRAELSSPLETFRELYRGFLSRWQGESGRNSAGLWATVFFAAGGGLLVAQGSVAQAALLFCAAELLRGERKRLAGGILALFGTVAGMELTFGSAGLFEMLASEYSLTGALPAGLLGVAVLLVAAVPGEEQEKEKATPSDAWDELAHWYELAMLLTMVFFFFRSGVTELPWLAGVLCVPACFAAFLLRWLAQRWGKELWLPAGLAIAAAMAVNLLALCVQLL